MEKLVVQKYGGSSLATAERIKNVARRVAKTKQQGYKVVVVVSAMGSTTDDLIKLAYQVSSRPNGRELDLLLSTGEIVSCALLSMALRDLGHEAISFSGFQAGIRTDQTYSQARILDIRPERIERALAEGKIAIVAGFQGVTEDLDITTLGRGGSDVTAVALAAKLRAERCEIYTDVEGVFTADPRIFPGARKLPEIDYEEMLELASCGAKVIHPRAVELGWVYNIPILVASSFAEIPGTLIHGGASMEVRNKVRGIAFDRDVAKITVVGVPDRPGVASAIFEPLARANLNVDTIVQNVSTQGVTDLTFTVTRKDLDRAVELLQPVTRSIGAKDLSTSSNLAKVSIVGAGMQTTPGYAARMFRALSERNINIELITTSEIRITCIINEANLQEAVQALHQAFELERAG